MTIQELANELNVEVLKEVKKLQKEEELLLSEREIIDNKLSKIYDKVQDTINPLTTIDQSFREVCQEKDLTDLITTFSKVF